MTTYTCEVCGFRTTTMRGLYTCKLGTPDLRIYCSRDCLSAELSQLDDAARAQRAQPTEQYDE